MTLTDLVLDLHTLGTTTCSVEVGPLRTDEVIGVGRVMFVSRGLWCELLAATDAFGADVLDNVACLAEGQIANEILRRRAA